MTELTDDQGFPCARCGRCGGTGLIPRYGHVLNGVCFGCHGGGYVYPNRKVAAARAEYDDAVARETRCSVRDLRPGDTYTERFQRGPSGGLEPHEDAEWHTVAEIEVDKSRPTGWYTVGDGPRVACSWATTVKHTDGTVWENGGSQSVTREGRTVDPAPYVAKATTRQCRKAS